MTRVLFLLLMLTALNGFATDDLYLTQVRDLEDRINRIEAATDPFDMDLFEPLVKLARVHMQAGDIEAALDHFQRAQHISHRSEGVHSTRQLEIITDLTNLALRDSAFEDADLQQEFAFFIRTHALEEEDPDFIAAYTRMADWYMFTGQARKARRLLEEALALAAESGTDPLPLAAGISKSRRLEGMCCRTDELEEALAGNPRSDPESLASAYIELGDANLLAGRGEEAANWYRRAHETAPLSLPVEPVPISVRRTLVDPKFHHQRAYKIERGVLGRYEKKRLWEPDLLDDEFLEPQWFLIDGDDRQIGYSHPDFRSSENRHNDPVQLAGHPLLFSEQQLDNLLPARWRSRKEDLVIALTFDVMADGDLDNIEITESNAPKRLERLVLEAMRKVSFRPALVDGEPVATRNVRLRQVFSENLREVTS